MKSSYTVFLFVPLCFFSIAHSAAPSNLSHFSENKKGNSRISMEESTPFLFNQRISDESFDDLNFLSLHIKESQLFSCNFTHTGLTYAHIESSNLHGSHFQKLQMPTSKISASDCKHCLFSEVNLFEVEIGDCNFEEASFVESDISCGSISGHSTLEKATFTLCDFSRTLLNSINTNNTSFISCNFTRAALRDLDCTRTIFIKPRFFKATVTNTTFARSTTLRQADFRRAKLSCVNFEETDLRGACFTGARFLEGTSFKNAKIDATTKATPEEIAKLIELGALMISAKEDTHHAKRARLETERP